MPVPVVCPMCGAKMRVKDEHAGRTIKCLKCGEGIDTEPLPPPIIEDDPAVTSNDPRSKNAWIILTILIVLCAFFAGGMIGYAVRAPQSEMAKLIKRAADAESEARRMKSVADESSQTLKNVSNSFGLNISSSEAEAAIIESLDAYKVRFEDSTAGTNGVPSRTAEIGGHYITLLGRPENIYKISVNILAEDTNTHLIARMLISGREIIDPSWSFEDAGQWFSKAMQRTDTDISCFIVRGKNRVTVKSRMVENIPVVTAEFTANLE